MIKGRGINIFHILIVGPLFILLGYVNLSGANALLVKIMRSIYTAVTLMLVGLTIMIVHTIFATKKSVDGFMIGGGRRLTAEQYDNTKLMSTQGRLQESREMLAKQGYPFTGLETHETHLKENFIAQNLPLWTEK
jgi:hypothetical protein